MPSNPWLKSLTLTTSGTKYSLLTLMQAIDNGAPARACSLQIQLDTGAGAAHLFIGNEDLSATNMGVKPVASPALAFDTAPQNLLNLYQIYLWSDTSGVRVNVKVLVQ